MNHAGTLGRTLIIANPASQSGSGEAVAWRLKRFLSMYLDDPGAFELVFTERPHHATELAAAAERYDTVVALGGDGVIHEVAGGLMRHPRPTRPTLGIDMFGGHGAPYFVIVAFVSYLVAGHRGVYAAQRIVTPKRRSLARDGGHTLDEAIARHRRGEEATDEEAAS